MKVLQLDKIQEELPLIVLDMANNHDGDLEHGLKLIGGISEVCGEFVGDFNFGLKFQYRHLDTFIHPGFKGRIDIKYVKRFAETRLTDEEFRLMKDEVEKSGLLSICTPFDERSVDLIGEHDFDILKIASCSFTDWPLLERAAYTDRPIIASTAGATLDEIDRVVSFLGHRNRDFAIMHCVGEYPTARKNLQLNQIKLLVDRYPGISMGFSTHEEPDNLDAVRVAVSQGAKIFERHVAVEGEGHSINAYSSTPAQIRKWLEAAKDAFSMCGIEDGRYPGTEKERSDLRGLKRGVFAESKIGAGEVLTRENVFYAIPCSEEQLVANDLSKYAEYTLEGAVESSGAINIGNTRIEDSREDVLGIVHRLKEMVLESGVTMPRQMDLDLSHHYGVGNYGEWGAAIFNVINEEYCKKLIALLPGQSHPVHRHERKKETFQVLYGDMDVNLGEERQSLRRGDLLTVERGVDHDFSSERGCIFEEVSTTHYANDSFYRDEKVAQNRNRKTHIALQSDWLSTDIK